MEWTANFVEYRTAFCKYSLLRCLQNNGDSIEGRVRSYQQT